MLRAYSDGCLHRVLLNDFPNYLDVAFRSYIFVFSTSIINQKRLYNFP